MEGQLNSEERSLITNAVAELKPARAVEVGTWLGGGSTLHILRTLEENGNGHLWGVEASESIYERMIANISTAGEALVKRFTPIFGFSQVVLPDHIKDFSQDEKVKFVFLDGGDNPMEQIDELHILDEAIPVGGILMSHDAKLRKGKWLIPYMRQLDNWECTLHDVSVEGLFEARKTAEKPSKESAQAAKRTLGKLKREPVEFIGQHLPTSLVNAILKFMPMGLIKRLTQGRK